jgi:hypothetical protein
MVLMPGLSPIYDLVSAGGHPLPLEVILGAGTAGGSRIIGMRRDDSIWTLVVTAIAVTINQCVSRLAFFQRMSFEAWGFLSRSADRRRYQAYKRIIKNAPRNPVSKTAAATKRLKASSSSPIKYKPLEVDPWICGNAL